MYYEIVAAVSKNLVIGNEGRLPWDIPEDLVHFKALTSGHIVIMGSNTYDSIIARNGSPLTNRVNVVVTTKPYSPRDNVIFTRIEDIHSLDLPMDKRKFVIGGAQLYKYFLPLANRMYITHIDKNVSGDTKFPESKHWSITSFGTKNFSTKEQCSYRMIMYEPHGYPMMHHDDVYKTLMRDVLREGHARPDRTGTGTVGVFGRQLRFDISESVPLLTTKLVPWKSVIKELLWFLRGDTDASILQKDGVRIWDGNTTREFLDSRGLSHLPEGDIGCGYGFQWRHFGEQYNTCKDKHTGGFDQIQNIIHQLKTDPYSRRIFMSAWNPKDMHMMALPPCHVSAQFYVDHENKLSCHMYQRSVDCFLGLPFNIFSYCVLTHILATICGFVPHELIISTGDTHIYQDHIQQIKTQLARVPISSPKLVVNPRIKDVSLEDITIEDFDVVGYFHHEMIKGNMSV
jgi:thymidylate synthase/dihydrofolate reductase